MAKLKLREFLSLLLVVREKERRKIKKENIDIKQTD